MNRLTFGGPHDDSRHTIAIVPTMSLETIKAEIARFLGEPGPGVLCLRGKWGVGKTYAWNEQLNAALHAKTVSNKVYAYVSLSGLTLLTSSSSLFSSNPRSSGR